MAIETTAKTPLLDSKTPMQSFAYAGASGGNCGEVLGGASAEVAFSPASFTYARRDKNRKTLPQAIAHRGYCAIYPENTLAAFKGAVEAGTDAIETDLHLSKDGVVVISHDRTLKRCFGIPDKIKDHDWNYLSTLRTIREPKQPMPRLIDLLEYLVQPEAQHIWLLLDIKFDNNADDMMHLLAETIRRVPPASKRPWHERIVLGCWITSYLPLCAEYLPKFPVTHITFSATSASNFFTVPNISFNLVEIMLVGPPGARILRRARQLQRPVYAWTVNKERAMRRCIMKGLDGVVTDDPKKFVEIRSEWENLPSSGSQIALNKKAATLTLHDWSQILFYQLLMLVLAPIVSWRFGSFIDPKFKLSPNYS